MSRGRRKSAGGAKGGPRKARAARRAPAGPRRRAGSLRTFYLVLTPTFVLTTSLVLGLEYRRGAVSPVYRMAGRIERMFGTDDGTRLDASIEAALERLPAGVRVGPAPRRGRWQLEVDAGTRVEEAVADVGARLRAVAVRGGADVWIQDGHGGPEFLLRDGDGHEASVALHASASPPSTAARRVPAGRVTSPGPRAPPALPARAAPVATTTSPPALPAPTAVEPPSSEEQETGVRTVTVTETGPAVFEAGTAAVDVSEGAPAQGAGRVRPLCSIIIDDLGEHPELIEEALTLPVAITYAVIPELPFSRRCAMELHAAGRPLLVHLPMEPLSYPEHDPGPHAIFRGMGDARVRELTARALHAVPEAVGVNNHMGSAATQDVSVMSQILAVVRERGLFFIDSRTSSGSVAFRVARSMGLRCAARQVFLDQEGFDQDFTRRQLRLLFEIARQKGAAIGIGHWHHGTLAVLREELPMLAGPDVSLVPVERLATVGR